MFSVSVLTKAIPGTSKSFTMKVEESLTGLPIGGLPVTVASIGESAGINIGLF